MQIASGETQKIRRFNQNMQITCDCQVGQKWKQNAASIESRLEIISRKNAIKLWD